ncbi:MoaD/ThiS family protein [Acidiphilium sp. AL]|uniref:MoaD/ThiS family protein n=1 Tax=Acidiphilium iwatense TaxID=768198 RepID=A0ABS9DRD9_9PROT|nr:MULTISPECIES: MoaD/ThiS family protein [Acidiphilium]MCF3945287.1 MoaD/ThiS family protein [Acidiphilium iwatense]MCU4159418.1 MoaD/ThiS family protein [Acidiphilium sp. AL]
MDFSPATVNVVLPTALVLLFPGCSREVAVAAGTVSEAIGALDARWPGMRDRLCDERPAIRRHINVFVGGERAGLATWLEPGAEMVVLMAISGG